MQLVSRISSIFKIAVVVVLTLLILIPLSMIRSTISERQTYREQAVATIARSEAGAQGVAGPVLVVPYTETVEVEETNKAGEVVRKVKRDGESGQWVFFPKSLALSGQMTPYTRRLGLHEVRMFSLAGTMAARFDVMIPRDVDPNLPRKIGRPWLAYGIADVRGLRGMPKLRVDGKEVSLERGLGASDAPGLHTRFGAPAAGAQMAFSTQLQIEVGGSEAFAFAPLGDSNKLEIDSRWPHPQFNGAFLPRTRKVDGTGFKATWEVSSLASNAQAQYLRGSRIGSDQISALATGAPGTFDLMGVSLVEPVNVYSQADRATKYGLLFVMLTFVGFFMFELIKQLRIHPIQYGLVGLALAIFFLLLVSLSEHIAFGRAYLAASAACIGLIGFYLCNVLHSVARGIGFSAMLAMLYAALYGLLVSEDNALVLGAGLLFVILAAIMVITRRVDWYRTTALPQ
ncbi:cell envelope integrity protein CreD [Luteimonas panaciterrae]|uniref:cell envelope integrity protein CreD n=1 Tax=Luteimonas panaciterrae TaxID=363885 RepID=UPI001CF98495|nr:cell envelope integrity protein CreD [Luteimonas panaciterrae]